MLLCNNNTFNFVSQPGFSVFFVLIKTRSGIRYTLRKKKLY